MTVRRPYAIPAVLLLSLFAACGPASDDKVTDTDADTDADTDVTVPCPDEEVPYNGIDDDCDPSTPDDDLDKDGDLADVDCNDEDPAIGPHAPDIGFDGVDQDCDGADLDASPETPSFLVDLDLPVDLVSPVVAVGPTHALVMGRDAGTTTGAGLTGALVDLATGQVTPVSQDAPTSEHHTRWVQAWARGDGFGVLVSHENYGTGNQCHLYGTPLSTEGTFGTRRQLTAVSVSMAMCDRQPQVVASGADDVIFHMQPQGLLLGGDESSLPHLVRRAVDLDDGTEQDVDGYGVNQSTNSELFAALDLAVGPTSVFRFGYGFGGTVTLVGVYDGTPTDAPVAAVLAAPPAPVSAVTNGMVSAPDSIETVALLRTAPGGEEAGPLLEYAEVEVTPGDPTTVSVVAGGTTTPMSLGRVPGLAGRGVVVADADGSYRAVWMKDGVLWGTTETVAEASTGDARLMGTAASLLHAAHRPGGAALLLSVGEGDDATLQLVLTGQ